MRFGLFNNLRKVITYRDLDILPDADQATEILTGSFRPSCKSAHEFQAQFIVHQTGNPGTHLTGTKNQDSNTISHESAPPHVPLLTGPLTQGW
jgi:hypothetical protein